MLKRHWFPAAVCAAYLAFALIDVDRPFLRHRDGVSAYYATVARNYVWHGYDVTRLGILETSSPELSVYENWKTHYYPNRPVVSVVALSLWFHVFGDREVSLRLNLAFVGMLTILVFAALARRLDLPSSQLATFFFALMPIFAYFSHVVPHLTYVLLFSLLAWYAHLRWEEGGRFRVLLFVSLFLACHSDWPGYFAALSIAADRFRARNRGIAFAVLGGSLAFFGLHLLHLLLLAPDGSLLRTFLRAGVERSPGDGPGLFSYLFEEGREVGMYFTGGALFLSLIGVADCVRSRWWTPLWFSLLGLEEILFSGLAFRHDYLTFSLAPFAALTAGRGAIFLASRRRTRILLVALVAAMLAQTIWILLDRQTRSGGYEANWRAAIAIREATHPGDRILLTTADVKQFTPYYSQRYIASVEPAIRTLCVHPSGWRVPVENEEDLLRYVREHAREYAVVVAGDADAARREIGYFGKNASDDLLRRFGFHPEDHPLRRELERIAVRRETRGAFVFYWRR